MAADLSSARKTRTSGFTTILTSAASEWFLIFLLFVNAVFSYLLRIYARYFELQTPCPLCSRLDHIFRRQKRGCCWSLVCKNHKEEISTLVSCSTHGKLADVHGMCEECLVPIAMENNYESIKLLVGKLGVDVDQSVLQNLMVNKLIKPGYSEVRTCSCCNKTWKAASSAERLLGLKPVGLESSKANAKPPLPHVSPHSHLRCRDSVKKLKGKLVVPKKQMPTGTDCINTLSHVGYSKLNFSSDSGSEFPLSEDDDDDEDGYVGSSGNNSLKTEDDFVGSERRDISKAQAYSVVLETQIHQVYELKDQGDLLDLNESKNVCSSLTDDINEHCLRKISSDDIRSSNSNSKNLSESFGQSAENMELSSEHELEPINGSDSARPEEDMKLHDDQNEPGKVEDSSSQRNDSSYESIDGISVDDIEGESIVDRLRRQVEHDRNCMESLYKELEEEQNAASDSVNEAMAMIMRLQEEKAALQMEARQYLRMMEEQSEYDKKALERANDLLSEREKELQDLEYELELYRNNSPDETGFEDLRKETSVSEIHAKPAKFSKPNDNCKPVSSSGFNFEDEKLYILQCLKKLEEKLYKAYSSGNTEDIPNGLNSYKMKNELVNLEEFPSNMNTILDFERNKSSTSNASNDSPADSEENDSQYEKSDNLSNSAAFDKEIAALHDRLESLETDRDLLKYASTVLQNGEDGMQLVQDLAHQLEESRKMEFRDR